MSALDEVQKETGAALDGISGLGHIVITLGLIFFFINLGKCLPAKEKVQAEVEVEVK